MKSSISLKFHCKYWLLQKISKYDITKNTSTDFLTKGTYVSDLTLPCVFIFNPLNTKRRLLSLKNSSYRAVNGFHLCYKNQSVYAVSGTSRCLFSDKYKAHKYSVGRTYSCWMLNCWCVTWPVGFKRLIFCNPSLEHATGLLWTDLAESWLTIVCSFALQMNDDKQI